MTFFAAAERALRAIDRVFEEEVLYYPGIGGQIPDLTVIWFDQPADPFQGAGSSARVVSCEVRQTDLADRPTKRDRVLRSGVVWRVNDITPRDDIGKWWLTLEFESAS